MTDSDKTNIKVRKAGSIAIVCLAVVCVYFLALRTGATYATYGFAPDCCWLLKFGELIFQTKSIPDHDPFIFTQAIAGAPPFVLYQWLAELFFYSCFHLFHPVGLVTVAAAISFASFVLIPLRYMSRTNSAPLWVIVTVFFLSTSSIPRSFVRPELFTCIFTAAYLMILRGLRSTVQDQTRSAEKISWTSIAALTAIMLLWANLHSGFTTGLAIMLVYGLWFLASDLVVTKTFSARAKTVLIAVLCSLVSTLINPYGIGLWQYLPHLYFAPVNQYITELSPLTLSDLSITHFYPLFFVLALTYGMLLWRTARLVKAKNGLKLTRHDCLSLLMIVIASTLCFAHKRLGPMMAMVIAMETAQFAPLLEAQPNSLTKLLRRKPSLLFLDVVAICVVVPSGIMYAQNCGISIMIPSQYNGFRPPFEAIMFFQRVYRGGKIFAHERIADMIDLYMPPALSLFVDTRMDVNREDTWNGYRTIINAAPGWQILLDRLRIAWVFINRTDPLYSAITRDKAWTAVREDQYSAIFERTALNRSTGVKSPEQH